MLLSIIYDINGLEKTCSKMLLRICHSKKMNYYTKRNITALKKHYCTVTASCEEAEEEKDDVFDNSNSRNSDSNDSELILETFYDYRKKWMKSALDQFCQRVCTPKNKK